MPRSAMMVVLSATAVVAAIGAWRLWPIAFPGTPTRSDRPESAGGTDSEEAALRDFAEQERAARAWLIERGRHVTPVESVEAFRAPAGISRARRVLPSVGISEQDLRTAVDHAATIMYLRYIRLDFEAYTRWRVEQGYRFSSAERLRGDRHERQAIEYYIGRPLREDELTDDRDRLMLIWREYWAHSIAPTRPLKGVDQTPEGSVVVAWTQSRSLSRGRATPPYRNAARSQIVWGTDDPEESAVLRLWFGTQIGTVWPTWTPPREVEARLEQVGTPMVEVAWVLQLDDGTLRPLSVILAMDRTTRRWWVLQWISLHEYIRGTDLNYAGL